MNHHKNKGSPSSSKRPFQKSPDQSKKVPVRGRSRLFTGTYPAKTQHELLHLHIPLEVLATFTIFIVTTSSSRERYLIAWRQKQSLPHLMIVKSTPLSTAPFFRYLIEPLRESRSSCRVNHLSRKAVTSLFKGIPQTDNP